MTLYTHITPYFQKYYNVANIQQNGTISHDVHIIVSTPCVYYKIITRKSNFNRIMEYLELFHVKII